MKESVILVDNTGRMTGTMEKLAAHREGVLHRAFSIFIFNSKGQLLLQQRAFEKYHSGGLWTNTCCSHPRPYEGTADAAHRRLMEEMGMRCDLKEHFQFTYRHEFLNGLIEYEYDHVFIGHSDQMPVPDPMEVADYKYVDPGELALALNNHPATYTPWLIICFVHVNEIVTKGFWKDIT
ncbi:isopentenyl-diphosphate Delta-isomerase [Mucilaginibacter sp. 21P]|uniref:isopentenyl-diphosphate Delta-isomerase n=1 Tax=Mucilaginibacter sp. 21P TaxID=2778902 RepID=UPI001C5856F5|nr:isopentenyl-diphosphate Delta-isomerase [Mucilaginibacter sp. 21P]QXV63782.1 isopentenyl-diphosphate Delta-isomerase [Mucilaginibacter sp. 21P]